MFSFSLTSLLSWRYLKKKHLDYLIVQSPPLLLGFTSQFLGKWSKSPVVVNVSDLWPLSAKEIGAINQGRFYKFLERIERQMYKKADIILGQSNEIVKYINNLGFKQTYLFRNGVDLSRFQDVNEYKRDKNNNLRIVYAGLLGYAQGILEICKTINFSKLGVEFHIYGQGGEQKDIELFLERHKNCSIYYHGVVSPNILPKILSNYNLSLIPLKNQIYGAVPSKIFESMGVGLPILFHGEGEGRQIVLKYDIGLASNNYDELIANILYFKQHPHRLEEMYLKLRNCAHGEFNRSLQIKNLYKVLVDNLKH